MGLNGARESLVGVSSSRTGMKRRSLFRGSRNRNVPASNCGQSGPKAWTDRQSTRARDRFSPSSILSDRTALAVRRLNSHSSNQTRSPSARSRSAMSRTISLSFGLWLRNTS